MRVLVFNVIYYNLVSSGNITCIYILVVDRTCSSLYEVKCSIKKYLSRNSICYIIQQKDFARRVPNKLLNTISGLFSIDFGTNEVIKVIKGELRSLLNNNKSKNRMGYIYEKDI